jgi:hypothetical protein
MYRTLHVGRQRHRVAAVATAPSWCAARRGAPFARIERGARARNEIERPAHGRPGLKE